MSTQEYLSVLVSIVVGLGLSQLLTGVGRLVTERHRVQAYWVALAQAAFVFLAMVQFWWSTFGYGDEVESNFFAFLFFLLPPIAMYLMAALILPDLQGESEGRVSLKEHYESVRPWFFGLAALLPVLNATRSVAFQDAPLWNQDRPFELVFLALTLSAARVKSERWHAFVALAGLALFVTMIVLVSLAPG